MRWRLAESLVVLRDELNWLAPNRSKVSDGTIGDSKHSSRVSDHNPNRAGVVRAIDITHDPKGGLDCHVLAEQLAAQFKVHPAMGMGSCIIWNRRIFSRRWFIKKWRPYTGSNPHTKHLHLSVATAASGYDSTQPWIEDNVTPQDKRDIAKASGKEAADAVWNRMLEVEANESRRASTLLTNLFRRNRSHDKRLTDIENALARIEAALKEKP